MTTAAAERWALSVAFAAFGMATGTFASRLPWIAGRLHLSSGKLGVVVLMSSLGALVVMPLAARFVHRYGPAAATRVLIVAMGVALALPPLAPNVATLAAVMLLSGAVYGTLDNAINAQAVEAERRLGKSIMSGLHGMWSLGVLAGALIGSLAADQHVDPRLQFAAVGAAILACGVAATAWFVGGPPSGAAAEIAVPRFVWPHGTILLIGLVGFAAIFVEYAASDWAAVFMHWVLHASQAKAALATGTFALAMAGGRLCGDVIVRRVGASLSVRACGALGTAGCLLVAMAPEAVTALAGFLLIGLGVSVVVPLVFASAGHFGPSPAIGVAGAATVSYGAGLAAPSAMGGIADLASLRVAFAAAALLAVGIVAGAGVLGRHARAEQPRAADLEQPAPVRRRSA